MRRHISEGMCKYSGDRDTDLCVVLIHGYVRNDMNEAIIDLIGDYGATECYQEGGYLLTVATNTDEPVEDSIASDLIGAIYEHMRDIPDVRPSKDMPVFVGEQENGYELDMYEYTGDENWNIEGLHVYFVAGLYGYEEDGIGLYQE